MTTQLAIGPALRRARENAFLTQEDLAARLGVSVRTVSMWETAPPSYRPWPRHQAAIAAFLRENGEAAA